MRVGGVVGAAAPGGPAAAGSLHPTPRAQPAAPSSLASTRPFDDGASLAYDRLLLATGADPVRLPLGDAARVHHRRTLADSRGIVRAAESARRAVRVHHSGVARERQRFGRARSFAPHGTSRR